MTALLPAVEFEQPRPLDVRCLILAGGLGTRLRPLTNKTPKPLIKIGKHSRIIDFILDWLVEEGIGLNQIALSLYYKPEVFYKELENTIGTTLLYSIQHQDLGTAGAMKVMESWLSDPFFVVNGDTITNVNLKAMLLQHYKYKAVATVFTHDDALHTGGVYLFSKRVFDYIPSNIPVSIQDHLMPRLIDKGEPIGLFRDETAYYYDAGTLPKLKRVRELFKGK